MLGVLCLLDVLTIAHTCRISVCRTYVAVAPQLLRPGNAYEVSVTILSSTGPVEVTANLIDENAASISANQSTIQTGKTHTGVIVLLVIEHKSYEAINDKKLDNSGSTLSKKNV